MKNVRKLAFSGLFAALTCIATLLIQITLPGGGYFNLGDCVVILSGVVLGPTYGFLAASIGSALADVFLGYMAYAPVTLLIKGVMACIVGLVYKKTNKLVFVLLSALCAEAIMVLGYFLYEAILSGSFLAALSGVTGNLLQGGVGIVSSFVLITLITKNKFINKFLNK